MSDDDFDADDFLSDGYCACPRCDGGGQIDCYCGGDLCVCDNYGERYCPLCCGEGHISTARYEEYQAEQRQLWRVYQEAMTRRNRPKPQTTSKRAKVKAARKQRQKK